MPRDLQLAPQGSPGQLKVAAILAQIKQGSNDKWNCPNAQCNKAGPKVDIQAHYQEVHLGEKPLLICPRSDCDTYLTSLGSYRRHRSGHSAKDLGRCPVPQCPKRDGKNKFRGSILNHLRNYHKVAISKYSKEGAVEFNRKAKATFLQWAAAQSLVPTTDDLKFFDDKINPPPAAAGTAADSGDEEGEDDDEDGTREGEGVDGEGEEIEDADWDEDEDELVLELEGTAVNHNGREGGENASQTEAGDTEADQQNINAAMAQLQIARESIRRESQTEPGHRDRIKNDGEHKKRHDRVAALLDGLLRDLERNDHSVLLPNYEELFKQSFIDNFFFVKNLAPDPIQKINGVTTKRSAPYRCLVLASIINTIHKDSLCGIDAVNAEIRRVTKLFDEPFANAASHSQFQQYISPGDVLYDVLYGFHVYALVEPDKSKLFDIDLDLFVIQFGNEAETESAKRFCGPGQWGANGLTLEEGADVVLITLKSRLETATMYGEFDVGSRLRFFDFMKDTMDGMLAARLWINGGSSLARWLKGHFWLWIDSKMNESRSQHE